MKKISTLILAVLMLCTALTACGNIADKANSNNSPTPNQEEKAAFTGTADAVLDQLINKTIEKNELDKNELKNIKSYHKNVDADSCKDILGLSKEEFSANVEAAVESKPEAAQIPHSIVVVKTKDGANVAALADKISKGTNPARFGCLKVESLVVGYAGRYIVLAATFSNTSNAIYKTFSELSAVPATRIDRENDWKGGGMIRR